MAGVPRPGIRESWSSRAGVVLASIGSAVGIGNLWRFPYVVGTSGGGAFLLPYVIAVGLCERTALSIADAASALGSSSPRRLNDFDAQPDPVPSCVRAVRL